MSNGAPAPAETLVDILKEPKSRQRVKKRHTRSLDRHHHQLLSLQEAGEQHHVRPGAFIIRGPSSLSDLAQSLGATLNAIPQAKFGDVAARLLTVTPKGPSRQPSNGLRRKVS